MQAHKIETVVSEDGTLVLQGLPFQSGEAVEVIILERSQQPQIPSPSTESPLQGTISFYDDPFGPAVPVQSCNNHAGPIALSKPN